MSNILSGDDARRFRLQLLNMCVTGNGACLALGYDSRFCAGEGARDIVWDATYYMLGHQPYGIVSDLNKIRQYTIKSTPTKGQKQKNAYDCCRSLIINRKNIIENINKLGDKIPSTPMTINEISNICTMMITFGDPNVSRDFRDFKLSIPLKMAEYLLGCENMISFLRYFDDHDVEYNLLMNKHSQLVRSLDFKQSYSKLAAPQHDAITLSKYLSMMPMVLLDIVIGYCHLCQNDPGDLDEIYNRLLTLDEFNSLSSN